MELSHVRLDRCNPCDTKEGTSIAIAFTSKLSAIVQIGLLLFLNLAAMSRSR